jgi:hypothetical protein
MLPESKIHFVFEEFEVRLAAIAEIFSTLN